MTRYDDTAITYLYGRYDYARRMMADSALRAEVRRDWAVRAEELRTCLRQLERWRVDRVGSRYQHEEVTAEVIRPPLPNAPDPATRDVDYERLSAWAARRPQERRG